MKSVSFYLDEDLTQKIDEFAKETKRSRSQTLSFFIDEYFRINKQKNTEMEIISLAIPSQFKDEIENRIYELIDEFMH